MTSIIQRHIDILEVINKASITKRKFILEHLSGDTINLFSQLAYNILKGFVPVNKSEKVKLVTLKPILKVLVKHNLSIKKKKELLLKNLNLIGLLISPVLRYFKI